MLAAGSTGVSWKLKSALQGSKTADFDLQLNPVLSTVFKWCTDCTTGNTGVSWKLKSAVHGNNTAGIDFQLNPVLSTFFKWCTDCTSGNTDVSWKLTGDWNWDRNLLNARVGKLIIAGVFLFFWVFWVLFFLKHVNLFLTICNLQN